MILRTVLLNVSIREVEKKQKLFEVFIININNLMFHMTVIGTKNKIYFKRRYRWDLKSI